jgi:hypothetical protein
MAKKVKAFLLSSTLVSMLLFSAFGTITVHADDGSGTKAANAETTGTTGEGEQPPGDQKDVVDQAGDGSQPTDLATVDAAKLADGATQTEETAPAKEPILEQVPDNTKVAVLNSAGKAVPLVSKEAANAILSDPDPIWCPAGQSPTPGANDCTTTYNSFNELLTFLQANEGDVVYQQAGTIYIQQGQYLGAESSVDFNNYSFNTFNTFDLTLQGGWDITDNSVDPADTTDLNIPIIIGSSLNPWIGSLTLNNINISGASGQGGLTLYTQGAVKITNSSFNGNEGYGLQIVSDVEVSLVNVEAQENQLFGAHIEGSDIAIDTGRFSNNSSGDSLDLTGRGLEIISTSTVSLLEVTANNNQLFGANILAVDQVAIERSTFNGHIASVSDQKNASAVGGYGLNVFTTGDIDLEDVTADNNLLYGAYLEGGDTTIVGNVGRNSFSGNGSGRLIEQPGNPLGYGLQIVSTGEVSLANINNADSEANQLFGLDVSAVGSVDILDAFFSGHQTVVLGPGGATFVGYGFRAVTTQGDIFVNEVVANFNNLWGCDVTGNNVIIADTQCSNNVSDSNVFIDDTGLLVHASGFVDLFNVDASNNRLIGADITAAGPVFIAQSTFNNNQGFTCPNNQCTAKNTDMVLHGYGLQVTTPDLILVSMTEANDNNLFGAQLNGAVVTVTDSTFNNNSLGDGLIVGATDNVTLTNIAAVNNGGDGADVTSVCGKIVQVTGGTFTDNDLYGISVINATLNLDGTQVFANNGSGNVFTDTGTCVVIVPAPVGP